VTTRPKLRLVHGSASAPAFAPQWKHLAAASEHLKYVGELVSLTSADILSIVLETFDFQRFRALLRDAHVTRILDARRLASFRGQGFSTRLVVEAFAEFGIEYVRVETRSNYEGARTAEIEVQLGSQECLFEPRSARDRILVIGSYDAEAHRILDRLVADLACSPSRSRVTVGIAVTEQVPGSTLRWEAIEVLSGSTSDERAVPRAEEVTQCEQLELYLPRSD